MNRFFYSLSFFLFFFFSFNLVFSQDNQIISKKVTKEKILKILQGEKVDDIEEPKKTEKQKKEEEERKKKEEEEKQKKEEEEKKKKGEEKQKEKKKEGNVDDDEKVVDLEPVDPKLLIQLSKFDIDSLVEFIKDYNIPIPVSQIKRLNKQELIEKLIRLAKPVIQNIALGSYPINIKDFKNLNISDSIKNTLGSFDAGFLAFKADEIYISQKKDKKDNSFVILFGNIKLELAGNILYADQVILKVSSKPELTEAIAEGNLLFITSNKDRFKGKKIIVYPLIQQAEVFDAQGYHKPLYLKSLYVKQIDKNSYVLNEGFMTSCNLLEPHYQLSFSKAWFIQNEFIAAENVTYKVSGITIAYLPIFYLSQNITPLRTSIGYEKGLGWFINNSVYYIYDKNIRETLKKTKSSKSIKSVDIFGLGFFIDFYQKLGIYAGVESYYKFHQGKSIYINTGVAYDRALVNTKNKDLIFLNYVLDEKKKYTEINNFRWGIESKLDLDIYRYSIFSSSLEVSYKNYSDPYFKTQFQDNRRQDFNLYNNIGWEESENAFLGNRTSNLNYNAQAIDFKLKIKVQDFYIQLSGDFDYVAKKYISPSYKVSDFKQEQNTFEFPYLEVDYSSYVQLIGSNLQNKSEKEDKDKEDKDKENKKIVSLFQKEEKEEEKEEEKKYNIKKSEYVFEETESSEIKPTFNLPLKYSVSLDFKEKKYYAYQEKKTEDEYIKLDKDIYDLDTNIKLGLPFTFSYKFFSLSLSTEYTVFYSYDETLESLKQKKEDYEKIDKSNSFPFWDNPNSIKVTFTFLKDYPYLKTELESSLSFTHKGRFEDRPTDKDELKLYKDKNEQKLNFKTSLTFLKTTFSVGFENNLYVNPKDLLKKTKDQILKDQKGNISLSATSQAIEYVSISDSISYSQTQEKWIKNSFSISLDIPQQRWISIFLLNSFKISTSWNKSLIDDLSNSLNFNFSIDFNLTKDWQFILSSSSSNSDLYLYTDTAIKYGEIKRNFFLDLLKSFNIFNQKDQTESKFNLDNLNFTIRHDLHHWIFELKLTLNVKNIRNLYYWFQPTIFLNLYLKDFFSFRYPKIKKAWTRD